MVRIGGVPYGVGAPLLAGLPHAAGREADSPTRVTTAREGGGVQFVSDLPSRLIAQLRAGELDAALVSSIEAFRRPGYRVASDLGICCRGAVHSVRAFRRPGATHIRRVALDTASETSVALLRLLLHHRLGAEQVEFERISATLQPAELDHDLVLLIGDCGLRADPGDREVLDLGELWQAWTGLPFVFALWLIAPDANAAEILPLLQQARERGRPLDRSDGTGGAVYYDLGPAESRGLQRFRDEAVALGLAEHGIEPEFLALPAATNHRTGEP